MEMTSPTRRQFPTQPGRDPQPIDMGQIAVVVWRKPWRPTAPAEHRGAPHDVRAPPPAHRLQRPGRGSPRCAFLAAPGPGSASAATAPPVFKVATSATIDTFNPFISIYLTPTGINRMVYENLVQYSAKDSSATEGLATKWETSSDGKTWTFHLRPGMKWSDNQPITSADPQWTYTQMMTDPDMGTANGSLVSNFAKVDAPDPETLVITMKEPQASNPGLEIPVVPKHVWEKIDDKVKYPNDTDVVGSGPYVLEKFTPSQSVVLKANPNFWKGKPEAGRRDLRGLQEHRRLGAGTQDRGGRPGRLAHRAPVRRPQERQTASPRTQARAAASSVSG